MFQHKNWIWQQNLLRRITSFLSWNHTKSSRSNCAGQQLSCPPAALMPSSLQHRATQCPESPMTMVVICCFLEWMNSRCYRGQGLQHSVIYRFIFMYCNCKLYLQSIYLDVIVFKPHVVQIEWASISWLRELEFWVLILHMLVYTVVLRASFFVCLLACENDACSLCCSRSFLLRRISRGVVWLSVKGWEIEMQLIRHIANL